MIIVFTDQSIKSLQEILDFLASKLPDNKIIEIRDGILDATDILYKNPSAGQFEPYLEHLNLNHRRIVFNHYKIIYRIEGSYIIITDIFDSRQEPDKMKA